MPMKSLPNNIEAEESVLGACFLSKYALQKACESLTPDSFYDEKNGKIFSAMNALVEEKTPIDITTVTGYLKKNNQKSFSFPFCGKKNSPNQTIKWKLYRFREFSTHLRI